MKIILIFSFIVFAQGAVELGCTTDPLPAENGCPPYFTIVTDGCCPDDDVYIVTPSTPNAPTTVTTSAPCQDRLNPKTHTSDCPMRVNLCTDPNYNKVMREQCPKTCEFCTTGSTTTAPKCSDRLNPKTGENDCPKRKYLCTDPTWKALMKDQCPKTCGYCK